MIVTLRELRVVKDKRQINALFIKTAPTALPLAELLQRNATAKIAILFIPTKCFFVFFVFPLIYSFDFGTMPEMKRIYSTFTDISTAPLTHWYTFVDY